MNGSNFYNNQVQLLERSAGYPALRDIKAQEPLNRNCPNVPIFYIMLSGGIVLNTNSKESPVIYSTKMLCYNGTPNQRLIDQLSKFLDDLHIRHDRPSLAVGSGKHRIISIKRVNGSHLKNWLIYSNVVLGKSYITARLLDSRSPLQVSIDFIANHSTECFIKLKQYGVICPKASTCHTHCLECPELNLKDLV